jgi:hypothetical protein
MLHGLSWRVGRHLLPCPHNSAHRARPISERFRVTADRTTWRHLERHEDCSSSTEVLEL